MPTFAQVGQGICSGAVATKAGLPLKSEQQAELERLRRDLTRVTMERDILKKSVGYFTKAPQ